MYKVIAVLCLFCSALLWAQTQRSETKVDQQAAPQAESKAPLSKKAAAEKKQREERGLRMLEMAEAQAGGLQGGMRAYAFWQLARTYQQIDKGQALELLESAMIATQEMEDDRGGTRAQLQQDILRNMVPAAPQRAEELLAQLAPENREPVLNALLGYYEKNKELDHAMELVYRIGQEKEIPYQAAGRIMAALPPERSGDLLQLFTVAFASFRDHEHPGVSIGAGDFGTIVLQFWQKLPPNLVHDAIHEMLKQAEKREDAKINMTSDAGSAAFNSLYEYRLFELLPVLRQIDPSEADDLLKKNEQTKGMLAKYPDGLNSLAPDVANPNAKPDKKGGMRTTFGVSSGGATLSQPVDFEAQQMRKILADADEHPDAALAQAAAISKPRPRLYEMIARAAVKKNPSVARSALDKLLGTVDQVQELFQLDLLRSAAELYLQMGDTDGARKVVERGFKLADKLQRTDTNADDPNQALKAYWPSAEAWRSFTRLAGQISPAWAMAQVNEISDPEMKVLAQTALAQQWLDVSRGGTMIMSSNKAGVMRMGSVEENQ